MHTSPARRHLEDFDHDHPAVPSAAPLPGLLRCQLWTQHPPGGNGGIPARKQGIEQEARLDRFGF